MAHTITIEQLQTRVEAARHAADQASRAAERAERDGAEARTQAQAAFAELDLISKTFAAVMDGTVTIEGGTT